MSKNSKESIRDYREFLKNVQDVLSTLAMLPVKIYDEAGEPLTSWSNPTFLHWMTDMVDFDYLTRGCKDSAPECQKSSEIINRAVDFYRLAEWLSRRTKKEVKKFINLEETPKGDDKSISDGFIHFLNENGPALKIVPIQWDQHLRFYVVVGGVWLAKDREEVDRLKYKFASTFSFPSGMTFTEKMAVFNEVEDLSWISRDDFARRCVRLKRSFRLIRHFKSQGQLDRNQLNSIMGVYRISEFRDAWRKYAEQIFKIPTKSKVDKILIAMTPVYENDKLKGYLWFFDRKLTTIREAELEKDLDGLLPATDIYLLENEEDLSGFLNGNLENIKKALQDAYQKFGRRPFEPLNFLYEMDKSSFDSEFISLFNIENGYPALLRLFVHFEKAPGSREKKHFKEKLETVIELMMEEFKGIVERAPRWRMVSENYSINTSLELITDIASYLKLSDPNYTCDLIRLVKNTFPYIEEIKYLRPRFYEGDRQFEVYCPLYAKRNKSEKLPEEIFSGLFQVADLKTLIKEGASYEPVAARHRVFSVMKFKHGNTWPEGVVERIGQRLSAVLTQRVPYRRFVHIVTTLREKLINYQFKDAIKNMSEDFLNSVAAEIAMGFTVHACTIWVYDDSEKAFYRKGAAGKLGDLLEKNRLDYNPYWNLISSSWELPDQLIKLPDDKKIEELAFGDELVKLGFNKGAAVAWKSAPDFGVVITLWSKLGKAWDLDDDDADRLKEIAHLISDSLKVKYDLYMLDIKIDEALTSIIHELKSPLVGVKDGVEYIADLAADTLAPALVKLEQVKTDSAKGEYKEEVFVYSLRKFQKSIREKFSELTEKIFSNTRETLEVTQKNMLPPFEYIWELIRFMTLYTSYMELDFSMGKLVQLKFWSDVVNDVVKRSLYWRLESKALKLHFEFDSTFPEWVYMPEPAVDALKIIIFNLVANAIKYSYHGTTIKMKGYIRDSFVVVEVQNQGIGVPEGEEKLIFEKCKRGSNVKSISAGGTGLGLFLSRELARKIGGDLRLTKNSNPTIFELTIPLKYFADFSRGGKHE